MFMYMLYMYLNALYNIHETDGKYIKENKHVNMQHFY